MVEQPSPSDAATEVRYPRRFRETESVNREVGRALRMLVRGGEPDAEFLDAIGRRLMARDEAGAALARAMRIKDRAHPDR